MKIYFNAMRNYVNFNGRATRSQFWIFILVFFALVALAATLDAALDLPQTDKDVGVLTAFTASAHLLPSWAIQARRLHDTDRSGWYQLISLVPILGLVVLFVLYCLPSTPGPNRFGNAPSGDERSSGEPSATLISAPASTGVALDRLEKLASLKASGALDEAKFQRLKAEIVGSAK